MILRNWVLQNVNDFNNKIKSEEDVKINVLIPFLKELGYETTEMRFENTIDVQIGTKKASVRSDIEIFVDGNIQLIIDTKGPKISIAEKEILQSSSYAKLISTPPAIYAVTIKPVCCYRIKGWWTPMMMMILMRWACCRIRGCTAT